MAGFAYCPQCEGIVTSGQSRCVLCGADLTEYAPLAESPAVTRDRLRAETASPPREPSKVLGVFAWLAQLTAGAMVAVFCILPAALFVIGVIVFFVRSLLR